jgi:hypothetical protein
MVHLMHACDPGRLERSSFVIVVYGLIPMFREARRTLHEARPLIERAARLDADAREALRIIDRTLNRQARVIEAAEVDHASTV